MEKALAKNKKAGTEGINEMKRRFLSKFTNEVLAAQIKNFKKLLHEHISY